MAIIAFVNAMASIGLIISMSMYHFEGNFDTMSCGILTFAVKLVEGSVTMIAQVSSLRYPKH